ncbi:uncharacterized protein BXZ73DRAFT_87317 [Epithele typhae]|uniref:uncharacterized protein n=1 Tax=Epithele typhae TaxID=378194 RepID=UPI0020076DA1|nr:uncharacterized protein BXZ73DRAFT_87317 [Epithele typhae]KAH9944412.1 hypothetical protein BXZ73DRAFT_87317 [Epithele typhae]
MYYRGVAPNPPFLVYRSNLLDCPFPAPTGRFHFVPTKTARGVFNTSLNSVWPVVGPHIRDHVNARKIKYSVIVPARFVTHDQEGDTMGPVVVWMFVYPNSTTAEDAFNATPGILSILDSHGIQGASVEWSEGVVEMKPTFHLRCFLTTALGMSVTKDEMEVTDAQGSVAFFFHENQDEHGAPSDKVFGVSNCHVLHGSPSVDYKLHPASCRIQRVRLAGLRRYQRGLEETKMAVAGHAKKAEGLVKQIDLLQQTPTIDDPNEAEELAKAHCDRSVVETFLVDMQTKWSDLDFRNIGHVHWAPRISVDVQDTNYTRDLATFEVEERKFKPCFKGNVLDLGHYSPGELAGKFYSLRLDDQRAFKWPLNGQLRIKGYKNGHPCFVVMKDGSTTDLTVGNHAGLEAFLCNPQGVESVDLAFFNYCSEDRPFSTRGDSGSLIVNGKGEMVGILHSGIFRESTFNKRHATFPHISFATPAWWVRKQLKTMYPHADFDRTTF